MPGTTDKKEVRLPRQPVDLVGWKKWAVNALKALAEAGGFNLSVQGASRVQRLTDNNLHIDLPAAAAAGEPTDVFAVRSDYSIVPGLVGGKMPRIGTTAINASTPPTLTVSGSGTEYLYFRLNFTITLTDGYLSAYTLDTVDIIVQTTAPADDNDTKHLLFNTLTDGVPTTSYFDTSIPITLWDNGYDSTLLRYGNL